MEEETGYLELSERRGKKVNRKGNKYGLNYVYRVGRGDCKGGGRRGCGFMLQYLTFYEWRRLLRTISIYAYICIME